MQTKTFEVRDAATFIPCIGIATDTPDTVADHYLLSRAGYAPSTRCILFGRLDGRDFCYDPYDPYDRPSSPRTLPVAHHFVAEHWDDLESGAVIDVEFILGARDTPKQSESVEF